MFSQLIFQVFYLFKKKENETFGRNIEALISIDEVAGTFMVLW